MVSRDNAIHFLVIVLALVVGIVGTQLYASGMDKQLIVIVGLFNYGILFGGAHLYLAVQSEGGMVPATSRWRFLTALAIWLVLAAIGALGPDGTLAGRTVDTVLVWIGVMVLVVYWILEARDGYLASKPS